MHPVPQEPAIYNHYDIICINETLFDSSFVAFQDVIFTAMAILVTKEKRGRPCIFTRIIFLL